MPTIRRTMAAVFAVFCTASTVLATELVMVEQHGCHYCARWNEEISHIYPNTAQGQRAPLRRVNLHDLPGDITFASRPVFTPTFVLVEEGRELGRMEGYAGDQFFWFLLDKLFAEHLQGQMVTQ